MGRLLAKKTRSPRSSQAMPVIAVQERDACDPSAYLVEVHNYLNGRVAAVDLLQAAQRPANRALDNNRQGLLA